MAKTTNLKKIVGIDVEPQLRGQAVERAKLAGVNDKIDFRLVKPRTAIGYVSAEIYCSYIEQIDGWHSSVFHGPSQKAQ